jgi:hypothetical protein
MLPWNNISCRSPRVSDLVLASSTSLHNIDYSLAYAELYLGLGMFLREFEFSVVTGDEEMALIDVFATFFNTRRVELDLRRRITTDVKDLHI